MSSRSTFSPSCEQTYCCFNREPHFLCSQLKLTAADDSADEYSLTGTETRPKEIVVDAMARALMEASAARGIHRVGSRDSLRGSGSASRAKRRRPGLRTVDRPDDGGPPPHRVQWRAGRGACI